MWFAVHRRGYTDAGIPAAALFLIAFLIHATETSTEAIFSSTSLMLVGLAFLAAHLAGVGSGWSTRRSGSRR
ncbi:hypothetical protein ACFWP7_19730 [Streptomyces sp. NPDC058470]|uniref:hypothetical protein n=1 Tax=Streptomyces sp. NPDC058470 TaxID=3346515 RepID=UPI003666DB40